MVNPVKIGGVETFSTVDFPDKIAAVVFMQGCPWRCPFCHNAFLQDASAADNFVWEKFSRISENPARHFGRRRFFRSASR